METINLIQSLGKAIIDEIKRTENPQLWEQTNRASFLKSIDTGCMGKDDTTIMGISKEIFSEHSTKQDSYLEGEHISN